MSRRPSPASRCGSCVSGVVLDHVNGIQRCDECKLFDNDQHAAASLFDVWVYTPPAKRKKYQNPKGAKS